MKNITYIYFCSVSFSTNNEVSSDPPAIALRDNADPSRLLDLLEGPLTDSLECCPLYAEFGSKEPLKDTCDLPFFPNELIMIQVQVVTVKNQF